MRYFNIYFSPTGGTKKVADTLMSGLSEEYVNIDILKDIPNIIFDKNDICLISVPSYGGRVPELAINRLKKLTGNNSLAILNVVYGNRDIDDTLIELDDTLSDLGFMSIASIVAVAEHSIFRMFGKGRPNDADRLELLDFCSKIKKKILSKDFVKLEISGNHYHYKKYNGPSLIPTGNDKCVGCGLCISECPVGAINSHNPKLTDKDKCIGCMRCVSVCLCHGRDFDNEFMEEKSKALEKKLGGYKKNYLYI